MKSYPRQYPCSCPTYFHNQYMIPAIIAFGIFACCGKKKYCPASRSFCVSYFAFHSDRLFSHRLHIFEYQLFHRYLYDFLLQKVQSEKQSVLRILLLRQNRGCPSRLYRNFFRLLKTGWLSGTSGYFGNGMQKNRKNKGNYR